MNELPISTLHELLVCDQATGVLAWRKSRGGNAPAGAIAGTVRTDGYRRVNICGVGIPAHRVVFAMTHGRWPVGDLDHMNCLRDDNRPANLREASRTENMRNASRSVTNTTGHKGVTFDTLRNRFAAKIKVGARRINLGYYRTAEAAAEAYQSAAEKHFGEFARAA